jgi:hypothetical protein
MNERLLIGKIRTDGGTQPRAAINDDVVGEYVADMLDGAEFPPVTVFYDGESYWLSDGFHRLAAYRRTGAHEVPAEIKMGTVRDAILHSVGANSAHGLRRTNADKRRAVMALLNDEEWSQLSDREVSRRCGVSDRFVNKLRPTVTANGSQSESAERTYTTKHGTTATMNTANIGRRSRDDEPEEEVEWELVLDEKEPDDDPEEDESEEEPIDDSDYEEDYDFGVEDIEVSNSYVDGVISNIKEFLEMVLSDIVEEDNRHYVVNETLKYLRQKSIEYNRLSIN